MGREPVGATFAPYPKTGGWIFTFRLALQGTIRSERVIELIALGQHVGYGWIRSGDVYGDLSGWSNEPSVADIQAIEWRLAAGDT